MRSIPSRYSYSRISFLPVTQNIKTINKTFSSIIASPDQKVGAAVSEADNQIYILAGTNLITTLSGNNPMFSDKGKTIFWISGNRIFRMPFHPNEIKRLLNDYKIRSLPEPNENISIDI